MQLRTPAAAFCVIASLSIAGCSGAEEPGTPITPGGSTAPPSPAGKQLPYAGAPTVENPLPASVMDRDPCTVLPAEAVTELLSGPQPGERKDTEVATFCSWSNGEKGSFVAIQLIHGAKDGLSQFYAKKDEAAYFEAQQPIQGYPVAAYGPVDDRQQGGACGVVVGIADDLVFEADATLSRANRGTADPCQVVRRVAEAALTELKAGA